MCSQTLPTLCCCAGLTYWPRSVDWISANHAYLQACVNRAVPRSSPFGKSYIVHASLHSAIYYNYNSHDVVHFGPVHKDFLLQINNFSIMAALKSSRLLWLWFWAESGGSASTWDISPHCVFGAGVWRRGSADPENFVSIFTIQTSVLVHFPAISDHQQLKKNI